MTNEIEVMKKIFFQQRQAFNADPYPKIAARIEILKQLKKAVLANQQQIVEAISADFGHRCHDETRIAELLTFVEGIKSTINHVGKWAAKDKRKVGILFKPAKNSVIFQPLGVVGIIVPWNYPLFLSIGPLIAAIAAGNRVMIKMSEFTPIFNHCLKQILEQVFDDDQVAIITGELEVATEFSALDFDHLFFTGSTAVGKIIMASAANNLTPVTLELGGKSPTLISPSFDIKVAAERICFGKSMNAGQTCVAPDYILCPKNKKQQFIEAYIETFKKMYPSFSENPDYSSIINNRQYERLQGLVDDAKSHGATIVEVEATDANLVKSRKMPPVIVDNIQGDMGITKEEIFGPILPIIEYNELQWAIDYINARPRPLALYLFSLNREEQNKVLYQTHSGGVCINNTLTHLAQEDLPFGGIGDSGMGQYHGFEGFMIFSKAKAVHQVGMISSSKTIYPPYGKFMHNFIYRFFIR